MKKTTNRFRDGIHIALNRRIVKVRGENAWFVQSQTDESKYYKVTEDGKCECPDHFFRGEVCKHHRAVQALDGVDRARAEVKKELQAKAVSFDPINKRGKN
jgi:hypothetical protein